jgi:hypothetical protein
VHRLVALLLTTALLLVLRAPDQTAMAISLQRGGCSPQPHVALQYSPAAVDASATVPCSFDGASFGGGGGGGWVSPPDGTDCSHNALVPITVSYFSQTVTVSGKPITQQFATISWQDPVTGQAESQNINGDEAQGVKSGDLMRFFFVGTFQGGVCQGDIERNPLNPGNCIGWLVSFKGYPLSGCTQPPIKGGPLPPSFIQPFVVNLKGQLQRLVNPGTISALPAQWGLVRIPSCFWLQGASVPNDQWFQLVIIGPDSIVYTLRIHIFLTTTAWNFDDALDPANSQAPVPPQCLAPGRLQLTSHRYVRVSDRGAEADGTYHVTATLTYGIEAFQFWFDGVPNGPLAIDLGSQNTLSVTTPFHPHAVIQEEAVPQGG